MQSRFMLNLLAAILLLLSLAVVFVGELTNPNTQSTAHMQDDAGNILPADNSQPEGYLTTTVLEAAIVRH